MLRKRPVFLLCFVFLFLSLSACQIQKKNIITSETKENKTGFSLSLTQEETEKGETVEKITVEANSAENKDVSQPKSETPSLSKAPAETPKEPVLPAWKQAYFELLQTMKDYHVAYALVYIDNDDIPELYLNGDCEAAGDGVYSYINGSIVEQRIGRTWGGRYIEKSGELYNYNGNMGCYYTHVYKLTADGFSQTFYALTMEELIQWENEEPILSYKYFVEDVAVSEEEYNNARNAAFNYALSKPLHENAVTYDQIVEQIKAHK